MRAISITADLQADIKRVFSAAQNRKRSADAKLPPNSALEFLKALPNLLSQIDTLAGDDAAVDQVRSALQAKPRLKALDHVRSAVETTRENLFRLDNGPVQPADRALSVLARVALNRLELLIDGESLFIHTTKKRPGPPVDPWSRTCIRLVARWWSRQGWKPQLTTSRDSAIVGVLRVLHGAHDKRIKRRKSADRDTLDGLKEIFDSEKLKP